MSGKLYSHNDDFRSSKVLISAQYGENKLTLESSFKHLDPKKFPLSKVPAFESNDGNCLFDSNAIAYYVANDQLRGKNLTEQASIIQWVSWADNDLYHYSCTWLYPTLGLLDAERQSVERAKSEVKKCLKSLNDFLLNHTYLVGERITLADITLCCNLLGLYQQVLDPKTRKDYPNVNRWFMTLVNQPQFKKVLGEVSLCETAAVFKEKEKDKKPKAEKQEQKHEESKKQKKDEAKAPDHDDYEDDLMPVQPPPKDPFTKFPKGNFDMDDFKRFYSNNAEDLSVNYFWEKFDKENYSIWFCEYLFPQELTLVFMSCNLISGMFQRLDRMRKHAFGSMILFGEDNSSTISGIWIWRGHELAFNLSEDWQVDYESYSWKKLDPTTDETKKIVNEYLKWSGDFGGKKVNQGKIFK